MKKYPLKLLVGDFKNIFFFLGGGGGEKKKQN